MSEEHKIENQSEIENQSTHKWNVIVAQDPADKPLYIRTAFINRESRAIFVSIELMETNSDIGLAIRAEAPMFMSEIHHYISLDYLIEFYTQDDSVIAQSFITMRERMLEFFDTTILKGESNGAE